MKKLLLTFLASAAVALSGQVLITNFPGQPGGVNFTGGIGSWNNVTADQFSVSGGVLTIGSVSGGNPDNSGYFGFADIASIPLNATGLTQLSVTAEIGGSNVSPGFIVNLFDGNGFGVLTATFSAAGFTSSGFTTQTVTVSAHPDNGTLTDIESYGIAGTGTTAAFNFLISNISLSTVAIPEPATYAAILGLAAIGLAAYRRRISRA